MSKSSVLWMQHQKNYVHKVELVYSKEVACSRGHDTVYYTIQERYDTYGYKEQGRVVCELCGTTYMLINPVIDE